MEEECQKLSIKQQRASIAETWARASIKIAIAILIIACGVGYVVHGRPVAAISYSSEGK